MASSAEPQRFPVPRGGYLLTLGAYILGILLGLAFVGMWLAGMADLTLGGIGLGMIAICGYLLPESIGPALKGDTLTVGRDGFQYVRAGSKVLCNIPFDNVDDVVVNERDGGRSLWVRLKEPEAKGSFWIGGNNSMNVIFSQCGYHLVVGQGLGVDAPSLHAIFRSHLGQR